MNTDWLLISLQGPETMSVRCRNGRKLWRCRSCGGTYHSDPLKGKDGRPKEQRVIFDLANLRQVDGISDVLHVGEKTPNLGFNIQQHQFLEKVCSY